MDKSEFTNTLKYGKCKCGNLPMEKHACPSSYMRGLQGNYGHDNNGYCHCCLYCFDQCINLQNNLDKMLVKVDKEVNTILQLEKDVLKEQEKFTQD